MADEPKKDDQQQQPGQQSGDKTPEPPKTDDKPDEGKLGDAGKAALAAERARADAAEAQLKKLELAKLGDKERAEHERDEAKAKAASAELSLMRILAADAAGLPISYAGRLMGNTQAELEADAKEFAEQLGKLAPKKPTPKPDGSQGKGGDKETNGRPTSVEDAKKAYLAARGK